MLRVIFFVPVIHSTAQDKGGQDVAWESRFVFWKVPLGSFAQGNLKGSPPGFGLPHFESNPAAVDAFLFVARANSV